jgi:tetratricopeptide (TPR) repeat protein
MHARPRGLARLATILLVAMPLVAVAGPKEQAKAHIAKATAAHKDGKFAVALDELQAAYKLDPKPDLLFAIAQVYVKLDNCADAIPFYEKFLASTKDPQAQPVVTEAIDACKAKLAQAQPVVTPTTTPEPVPEPVAKPEPEPKPEVHVAPPPEELPPRRDPVAPSLTVQVSTERPWYRDTIADSLLIGGVIAGVVGIVVYSQARSDLDSAESSTTLAGYNQLVDSSHSKQTLSIVLVGGGAALIGGGVVRLMLRDHGKSTHGVGMIPTSGGGLVTWTGGF